MHELLWRLYAYGPLSLSPDSLHPWLRGPALRALRLGLVEHALDGALYGALAITDERAHVIRLAPLGRARLALPAPAPIGDRDQVGVLNQGVRHIHGWPRYQLVAGGTTREGTPLIAKPSEIVVLHPALMWFEDLVARYAAEQGVACCPSFTSEGRLLGFAALGGSNGL